MLSKFGDKAKVLAGGTDLVVQMKREMVAPRYVVNIGNIKKLDYIRYDDGLLCIGALATIRSLELSQGVKQNHLAISEAARQLASIGVRNIATLGGNLCNASPWADMAPILIGLGAQVKISGPKRSKEGPAGRLF